MDGFSPCLGIDLVILKAINTNHPNTETTFLGTTVRLLLTIFIGLCFLFQSPFGDYL